MKFPRIMFYFICKLFYKYEISFGMYLRISMYLMSLNLKKRYVKKHNISKVYVSQMSALVKGFLLIIVCPLNFLSLGVYTQFHFFIEMGFLKYLSWNIMDEYNESKGESASDYNINPNKTFCGIWCNQIRVP